MSFARTDGTKHLHKYTTDVRKKFIGFVFNKKNEEQVGSRVVIVIYRKTTSTKEAFHTVQLFLLLWSGFDFPAAAPSSQRAQELLHLKRNRKEPSAARKAFLFLCLVTTRKTSCFVRHRFLFVQ